MRLASGVSHNNETGKKQGESQVELGYSPECFCKYARAALKGGATQAETCAARRGAWATIPLPFERLS